MAGILNSTFHLTWKVSYYHHAHRWNLAVATLPPCAKNPPAPLQLHHDWDVGWWWNWGECQLYCRRRRLQHRQVGLSGPIGLEDRARGDFDKSIELELMQSDCQVQRLLLHLQRAADMLKKRKLRVLNSSQDKGLPTCGFLIFHFMFSILYLAMERSLIGFKERPNFFRIA